MRFLIPSTGLALACLASGCAAPAAPAAPDALALPGLWARPAAAGGAGAVAPAWWRGFGNAELDALVGQARRDNADVAVAAARLQAARAAARVAGATRHARTTVGVDAAKAGRLGGDAAVENAYGVALTTRYELDLRGRNAALRAQAASVAESSAHDRSAVDLSVAAATASAWLRAVSLRERSAIARSNLHTAERLLSLVDAQARAGAATPLALAQQRGLVAAQQRTVAALRQQAADAVHALTVWVGETRALALATDSLQPLHIPAIDAGLPADLLSRRPDVARAEALLAAAGASVTAARAAMLPGIDLSATLGVGGARSGAWLRNPVYGLAAGLAAPLFDGGALAGERDEALARREEASAEYRRAVVNAVAEVETALQAMAGVDAQRTAQAIELVEARRALALAESRYRAGADSLLALLDAQRSLYLAQDLDVQLRAARLDASVALYKALGGGWQATPGLAAQQQEAG